MSPQTNTKEIPSNDSGKQSGMDCLWMQFLKIGHDKK